MSDLKKMTVVVKNFNLRASGDIDATLQSSEA